MIAMRVVKTAINEVIHVVTMRHGFMTTARTMPMGVRVNLLCAAHRVLSTNLNDMLFGIAITSMDEMAILQMIHVIPVANSRMTTVGTVSMSV
jgi:hypothetical protein